MMILRFGRSDRAMIAIGLVSIDATNHSVSLIFRFSTTILHFSLRTELATLNHRL